MYSLLSDLRYALRGLRRSPGFASVAVITLALGIAAATTGFNLLNWVLLRPLPGVENAGDLGLVWFAARLPAGSMQPSGLLPPDVAQVAGQVPALSALAGYQGDYLSLASPGSTPEAISTEFVMPAYFTALGTRMEQGRPLGPGDYASHTASPVAVISDRVWRTRLGSRPDVVGLPLKVNGVPVTVIGVAEGGFRGIERLSPVDLWLPSPLLPVVRHFRTSYVGPPDLYEYVARLAPGATWAEAQRQLEGAIRRLAAAHPDRLDEKVAATVFPGVGLRALGRGQISYTLKLVMTVSGLVLLVACANVGNLLLFRRLHRREEGLIRLALGAGRLRLFRYHLAETALLGIMGAIGAVLLLPVAQATLAGLRVGWAPIEVSGPDWRVFGFAVAIGLASALIAGVIPAWLGSRANLAADLKEAGPTRSRKAPRLRTALAVVQIAVALTLVSGSYLLARTLQHYAEIPLGLDPDAVHLYSLRPKSVGYSLERARPYLAALMDRVRGLPGVREVALAELTPFSGLSHTASVRRAGMGDANPRESRINFVTASYFAALHLPLLRGTTFRSQGISADSVDVGQVVLSQSLAHRLFGDADPIGQLVVIGTGTPISVVGVAGDSRWLEFDGVPDPMAYVPLGQTREEPLWLDGVMVLVKTQPGIGITSSIRTASQELDPSLPVEPRGTMEGAVSGRLADQTFMFRLVRALALITLILTGVGIYSLVSFAVASRSREFGIRLALGADMGDLIRSVLGPSLLIALTGVGVGVGGALMVNRFIQALLFQVSPFDAVALVFAAAMVTALVLLASWAPVRRATLVDPATVLREE